MFRTQDRAVPTCLTTSAFEPLEARRMLAATGAVTLDAGVVSIEGTRSNDLIEVNRYLGKGGQLTLDVRINGRSLGVFRERHVARLKVLGGMGDDNVRIGAFLVETAPSSASVIFTNDGDSKIEFKGVDLPVRATVPPPAPLSIPATVLGGSGRDTVFSGDGDDHIEGGGGDDVLSGNGGDDEIFGQGDDDSVYGGAGSDTLEGGSGRDDLDGEGGIIVYVAADRTIVSTFTLQPASAGTITFNGARGSLGSSGVFYAGVAAPSADDVDVIIGSKGGDTFHKTDKASERRDFNEGIDRLI